MHEAIALLSNKDVVDFIRNASAKPIDRVALQLSKSTWPAKLILDQLTGRKKAQEKLPSWYANTNIVYPARLAMEQCSSEVTAQWKAKHYKGQLAYDLSGGFGVDTFCLSSNFKKVVYIEPNTDLFQLVQHNLKQLDANNVVLHNKKAEDFLLTKPEQADLVYIDPARRDENNRKKHRFQDCIPNVCALLPTLLSLGKQVVIKSSPFLDIDDALRSLSSVQKVTIIAVNNECKEVLYTLQAGVDINEPIIEAVQLSSSPSTFTFKKSEEAKNQVAYSPPLRFLYEPNNAMLKAGAFKTAASRFKLAKLHHDVHLYTSNELVDNFPGRVFEVVHTGPFNKRSVESLQEPKAIIVLRHFPVDVKGVLKKLGLTEGGEDYLFCTSDTEGKPMLIITRLVQR